VAFIWAMDAVCRVCCKCDRRVWWPRPVYNGSIRRGTFINTCWPALGSLLALWHTCEHLELSQRPHTSLHSSPCIRLRSLSEIEWFKCIDHCVASRGTWGIILLRDFLLLLVVAATKTAWSSGGGPARVGDCSWPAPVIVLWGVLVVPRRSAEFQL
jgi:hypothetical protein